MTDILIIFIAVCIVIDIILKFTQKNNNKNNFTDKQIKDLESSIKNELDRSRNANAEDFKRNREEFGNSFKNVSENLDKTMTVFKNTFNENIKNFNDTQKEKFTDLAVRQENVKKETENKLKEIRETVEIKLSNIQQDNNKRLDDMRKVVDEKLEESVNKKFKESFNLISNRLESVQKSLGEMKHIEVSINDFKKVFSNVKTRGTFGEIQLDSILAEFLSPEQYIKNAHVDDENTGNVVEFAVKLPEALLPIDSKFPVESYRRLINAYEHNNELVEQYLTEFERSVEKCAKDICDKYIKPPKTSNFAFLFVPTEGLYAEILHRPGFFEKIQRQYRVTIVGPTNLVAVLNSLQMGFRTLAIQKKSGDIAKVLGEVKTEFENFTNVLDKVKKNFEAGMKNFDNVVSTRTNAMRRKLKNIQALPLSESTNNEDNFIEIPKIDAE